MFKCKNGREINPDTFIYSVSSFRLVHIDEEYIFIRVAVVDQQAFFIMIDKHGRCCSYPIPTKATFHTQWGSPYAVYECEVDNIDVEYH